MRRRRCPWIGRAAGVVAMVAGGWALGACAQVASHPAGQVERPAPQAGVSLIRPRCSGATICILGQVVAAEDGSPLPSAAIFLQAESQARFIVAKTDEQGVFTVIDPPAGQYRLAVYQRARKIEVRGVEVGPGTTLVPIRLAPG